VARILTQLNVPTRAALAYKLTHPDDQP
jgi:hypothetical protein